MFLSALPAKAWQVIDFDVNSDIEMDRRYDFIIDVKFADTNYLNYPGSTLKPLARLLVKYRLNPRFGENCGKFINYEYLWYGSGHAVGCRRVHELDIPPTYVGAIRINPSVLVSTNSNAISGAIARLALDLRLKNCVLTAVFLPKDVFEFVTNDLSRFNFFASAQSGTQTIILRMYSNPLYKNPESLTGTLYFAPK